MSSKEEGLDGCLWGMLTFALVPVMMFTNGFALMKLWSWFVVTVFETAPTLTLWQALGLALVASMFTGKNASSTGNKQINFEIFIEGLANVVLRPGVALLFGWVYLQFIPA